MLTAARASVRSTDTHVADRAAASAAAAASSRRTRIHESTTCVQKRIVELGKQ